MSLISRVKDNDPSQDSTDTRLRGKCDRDIRFLSIPHAWDFLPISGFPRDRQDTWAVSPVNSGTGISRTHAWNPGLQRYHKAGPRTGMRGNHSSATTAVLQEYNGTKTRMREHGTREGTTLPPSIREHRNDMPRLSTTPGDGMTMTRVQYFTGCSGERENNDWTAPGITPFSNDVFRLHRSCCHLDNDGPIGDAARSSRVSSCPHLGSRRPDSAAMGKGGIVFSG